MTEEVQRIIPIATAVFASATTFGVHRHRQTRCCRRHTSTFNAAAPPKHCCCRHTSTFDSATLPTCCCSLCCSTASICLPLPSTNIVCKQDQWFLCLPPQQDKSCWGEAPKSGWQSLSGGALPESYLHVGEWREPEGSSIDAVTSPKKIPLSHHLQVLDSSISGRRECSPDAGFGQFILNTWGSRARSCKPGGVLDCTFKGVHWWSARLCSQSQPCESPVLSVPNLPRRASTWSLLEGCFHNFQLGLLTHQPLQASWVLESSISWRGSWGEYAWSHQYRWE